MLALRVGKTAPRRPPHVLILGPPGSGRYTQAALLSEKFGLVHVSARDLLKAEIKEHPTRSAYIKRCMDKGELVPETVLNQIIEQRLRQADCRINGFVLEGYPNTQS